MVDAEDGAGEFRPPRADEARKAQDFTFAHAQGDGLFRIGRCAHRLDIEHARAGRRGWGNVERFEVAADHQTDHRVMVDLLAVERADRTAVAQHHDAIGALLDLV
jgi:hypothetical protein